MPENSNPNDSPPSAYQSRMSSLGLDATPRNHTPKSGPHLFAAIAVGVLVYLILAVLINVLIGGIVGGLLLLADLVLAVVVGRVVYRTLQRRAGVIEDEEADDTGNGS